MRSTIAATLAVVTLLLLIAALPTSSAQGFEVDREASANAGGSHATVGLMCSSFETGGPTPQCLAYREVSTADDPLSAPPNVTFLAGTSGSGGAGDCVDRNCLGADHQDGGTVAVGVGDLDGDGTPDHAMVGSDVGAAGADHDGSYAASGGNGCDGGDGGDAACGGAAALALGVGPHDEEDRASASGGLRDTDGDGQHDDVHLMAEAGRLDTVEGLAAASLDASDEDGDGAPDEASVKVIKKSGVREAISGIPSSKYQRSVTVTVTDDRGASADTMSASSGEAGGDGDHAAASWSTGSGDGGDYEASLSDPGNASAGAGGSLDAGVQGGTGDDYISGGLGSDHGVAASTEDEDGDGTPDDAHVDERAEANGRKTVKPGDV